MTTILMTKANTCSIVISDTRENDEDVTHDALTGLPNRYMLDDYLKNELSQ